MLSKKTHLDYRQGPRRMLYRFEIWPARFFRLIRRGGKQFYGTWTPGCSIANDFFAIGYFWEISILYSFIIKFGTAKIAKMIKLPNYEFAFLYEYQTRTAIKEALFLWPWIHCQMFKKWLGTYIALNLTSFNGFFYSS